MWSKRVLLGAALGIAAVVVAWVCWPTNLWEKTATGVYIDADGGISELSAWTPDDSHSIEELCTSSVKQGLFATTDDCRRWFGEEAPTYKFFCCDRDDNDPSVQ